MIDRDYILAEIRRTAAANDGVALGRGRFAAETGIKQTDVERYWARWSDAIEEAGLRANTLQERFDDDRLLSQLAVATRRLGHWPTERELRLLHREDSSFPSSGVYARFGQRTEVLARLVKYCADRPADADVLALVEPLVTDSSDATPEGGRPTEVTFGAVYILRVGKHYKLGRTNAFGRRERELAIQLPERAQTVHVIRTDDPVGIEAYWHGRFADRRGNGEWFALTAEDVAAFKRRKFM